MSNQTDRPTTAQEVHETLYDGCDCPITYRDGRRETVKVRRIPRDQFAHYAGLIGGAEEEECALYVAGKDAAWAESLTDDSYDQVLAEGQRLNFTRLANWFERQTRRLQLVKSQQGVMDQAAKLLEGSPSLKKLLASTNGS